MNRFDPPQTDYEAGYDHNEELYERDYEAQRDYEATERWEISPYNGEPFHTF
jgi:hypothetical protein